MGVIPSSGLSHRVAILSEGHLACPVVLITSFRHNIWILLFQILSTAGLLQGAGSAWTGRVAGANMKLPQRSSG